MAEEKLTITYRVRYEHDSNGRWFVRCPDVPGAHSHGRTLASARNNIREAIALVLDLPDGSPLTLDEEFELDDLEVKEALDHARQLRKQVMKLDARSRTATLTAIATVKNSDESLSMRDLADLVGLSHQRIQQISKEIF